MRFAIASLALVGAVVFAGCAAQTEAGEGAVSAESAELSTAAKPFIGSYSWQSSSNRYVSLSLKSDGSYIASITVQCFAAPCNPVAQSGTWSVVDNYYYKTLKLTSGGSSNSYTASLSNGNATLKLSSGTFVEYMKRDVCGGIAGFACPTGETCVYSGGSTSPNYPDEMGACFAQGERGTPCGGIAGLACESGLQCIITATYPDAMGTCRAPGDEGTACGGIAGLKCNAGLTCKITASYPDAMGVCTK